MASSDGAGPLVIGYDGAEEFENVLRRAAPLLAPRQAIVVVVWEPGVAYDMFAMPRDVTPAPLHVDLAVQYDRALYEGAQRLAAKGAELARQVGFDAGGLAVADELSVPETIVHIAEDRDASGILLGARGAGLTRLLLGSTSQGVMKRTTRPVVVVRREGGD
jgi:nucleotide-binding universal stress UspA family protein